MAGSDGAGGAVVAVRFLVGAADDGEHIHNVGDVVSGDAVEVEEAGVELEEDEEAPSESHDSSSQPRSQVKASRSQAV